jgi:hypothetical protein
MYTSKTLPVASEEAWHFPRKERVEYIQQILALSILARKPTYSLRHPYWNPLKKKEDRGVSEAYQYQY